MKNVLKQLTTSYGSMDWKCYLTFLATVTLIHQAQAQKQERPQASRSVPTWLTAFETGASHQFQSDLDGGGDVDLNTFYLNTSFGYGNRRSDSIALSVGYQHRAYDFEGTNLLPPASPWDQVHFLSVSLPIRKQWTDDWMMIVVPTLRTLVEDMEDADQNLTGGGIVGFSYQINPRLRLGPGFGIITQIEDSTSFFPVIVVNWAISEKWTLRTGRANAASQGPGLSLTYALNASWNLSLSGRFERFRFRMDQQGPQANGVGEDQSAAVYLGAAYSVNRRLLVNVFTGLTMAGELSVSDPAGNEITQQDYDTTPILGANLQFRF